jgi:hypothetical protein
VSSDVDEATEWLEAIKAYGVEGPVVKGASTKYQPGRTDWVKINSVGVRRVRFAGAAGVVPGQHAARHSSIVRDGCRGREAPSISQPRE